MNTIIKPSLTLFIVCSFFSFATKAQSILPPIKEWNGASEKLIVQKNDPWITPTEKSGFTTTPDYTTTMNWLKKLCAASPLMHMVSIGKSVEGRDIYMVIASTEKMISANALKKSAKPLLLVQAGIHSGEIDGKDAGMMLLRDIAFGNKKSLLHNVNFLFIPILNVDGHERSSSFNRPNQRGPENMGWRTNAQNLNLNRDYTKLDTKEIRAVIQVMNAYDPLLYIDIHVTDGADYQYDITYGGFDNMGYSKNISYWLEKNYKQKADEDLAAQGHIPGQLLFAANDRDFSMGNVLTMGEPRFSNSYGDLRHMASVLVENHSLKPFRQRVLGTYVLLESTMKILATDGKALLESTRTDKAKRVEELPMKFTIPQLDTEEVDAQKKDNAKNHVIPAPDSLELLGIASKWMKSGITGSDYVQWLGNPITLKIPNYKGTSPADFVRRPKGYYVPASCTEVIERMRLHGIKMEMLQQPLETEVEMYRIQNVRYLNGEKKVLPFEGHVQIIGTAKSELRKQQFAKGAVYISTDQPLGDLAMVLLEPQSPDSYFQWGFFMQIFQRTEYIEEYVMEPTMQKMLDDSPELQIEFEEKKKKDSEFAKNPGAIYAWFYSKTKYYDERYLLYPVARKM